MHQVLLFLLLSDFECSFNRNGESPAARSRAVVLAIAAAVILAVKLI